MVQVTVYRWRRYDITTDETTTSRRYATLAAIEEACGKPIEGSAIEIDEDHLDPQQDGMTPRDYVPNRRTGFQTEITR